MDYNDLIKIPFDSNDINGVNCYTLLRKAYKKHNIDIPTTNISVCACREAANQEIQAHAMRYWEKVDSPEVPCGVLILSVNPDFANHIATYIGNGKILHITKNTSSIIERMYPKYKNRIVGFYRFIGDK